MSDVLKILNDNQISQKILRLSWQVYEDNFSEKEITLVGIGDQGLLIAEQVKIHLNTISKLKTSVLKINVDRDKPFNKVNPELPKNKYSNKVIILIDDVLHSGKTLTYAFKNFLDTSIKKMAVLVLIDRNHNSFPVKANYVGLSLSTTLKEYIEVVLKGKNKGVYLS
ncbi:phosphoribosyltransferase family protein [Flavobacteriales bacterium]|nr:phosphoribosyltransferase family protein [Flavobacteriales bacterium]